MHAAREVDEAYGVSESRLVHLVHLVHSCQYLVEMDLMGRMDRTLSAARRQLPIRQPIFPTQAGAPGHFWQ